MRVDDVERLTRQAAALDLAAQRARERPRLQAHAEHRNVKIARMANAESGDFLFARHVGEFAVPAGKARQRRDHRRVDPSRIAKAAQAVRDEDAVSGLARVGEQRRQREQPDGASRHRSRFLRPFGHRLRSYQHNPSIAQGHAAASGIRTRSSSV
jgi:hypothetical protein